MEWFGTGSENDCPFDCAGIPGGNAYLDDCGICSGPSTGHMPNSDVDQCGVCFGGNEAQQGCGCFNGFPSNYWYDFDNDGFGSCTAVEGECLPCEEDTECELFCGWDVPSDNWADNSDDSDDNCYSNVHDCAGVCDGNAVIQDFWFDNDDDGFGFGDEIQSYCTADVPEGWVPNNSDSDAGRLSRRAMEWREASSKGGPQRTGQRSEERRVGKECRSRWSPYH